MKISFHEIKGIYLNTLTFKFFHLSNYFHWLQSNLFFSKTIANKICQESVGLGISCLRTFLSQGIIFLIHFEKVFTTNINLAYSCIWLDLLVNNSMDVIELFDVAYRIKHNRIIKINQP